MEIKTKAYLPFEIKEGIAGAIVTEELILKNKELIGFKPMPADHHDWGFNEI